MPTGVVTGGLVEDFFLWELKEQGIPWAGGMPTSFSGLACTCLWMSAQVGG